MGKAGCDRTALLTISIAGAEPGLARLIADEVGQTRPGVEVVCYDGGPVPLLIGVE